MLTPEAPISDWLDGLDHWIGNSPVISRAATLLAVAAAYSVRSA
ncbi:hypothetical protein RFM99_26925 [Mesorhizobium sp. VK4C]|nr:hypothetical protein [Mesorhizobium sp. VK4C]MDX8502033.1 hypothetical protein [Mesorhizobium sp. VK4C]